MLLLLLLQMYESYAVGGDVLTMIECSLEVDRMMDHGNTRNTLNGKCAERAV